LTHSLDDNDQRFRTLMLEHQSMVFSIALRILGDRSAAEEAAQDVFIELHAKLGGLASDQHVLYWLWLQQLVGSLPAIGRTILLLRYQEDMSPEEISATLDMPVATVKSHLQRTLRLLREKSERVLR